MTKITLTTQEELDLVDFSTQYQLDIEEYLRQRLLEDEDIKSADDVEKAMSKAVFKFYVDVVIEVEVPESEEE